MGKWDAIVGGLSKLPAGTKEDDEQKQYEIDEHKTSFTDKTPAGMAHEFVKLKKEVEEKNKELKKLALKFTAAKQLLIDVYEQSGIKSQTLAQLGAVRMQPKPYLVITDKEVFREWCIQAGYADQMNLHHSTANSIVCEMLLENQAAPPGTDVYVDWTVVFTKE